MTHVYPAALGKAVQTSECDAYLLLSPPGFTFATGFRVPTHPTLPWRHAAALATPEGVAAVMAVDMEATTVESALPNIPLYVWREFSDVAMEVLAGMIRDKLGSGPLRLGLEMNFVPVAARDHLAELLPQVEWVPCDREMRKARAAKSSQEQALVRELTLAADNALYEAIRTARAGDTESDIGGRIIESLYGSGIPDHRALLVMSGERSWYPNLSPSLRKIQYGDVVRVEIFGARNGYVGGVARTAVVGEPSAELSRLWKIFIEARNAGLELLKPGANPRESYIAYTEMLGELKSHAISFFGHGMGLDLHERPYLSAQSNDEIVEGAILGVEPFTMIPGKFGLQIKDVVAITVDGYEMISDKLDGGELAIIAA